MSDAQRLIDKASELLTSAVKAGSQASHDAYLNIAQATAFVSIAISLNKIAEGDDHNQTHPPREDH